MGIKRKNFFSKMKFNKNIKDIKSPSVSAEDDEKIIESIVFASREPIHIEYLLTKISKNDKNYLISLLDDLSSFYNQRGVNFIYNSNYCIFQTSPSLKDFLVDEFEETKDVSKAAKETLAIIAYHQPTTRAEVEEIRGISSSKGSIDVLLDCSWIEICGKKDSPGRPLMYRTTKKFLLDFNLGDLSQLPKIDDLKQEGLLSSHSEINSNN
tara:strand:+ start:5568 stop:6197 length:630 start_codon:yes stop_codon:yes gene_type:complete